MPDASGILCKYLKITTPEPPAIPLTSGEFGMLLSAMEPPPPPPLFAVPADKPKPPDALAVVCVVVHGVEGLNHNAPVPPPPEPPAPIEVFD